MKFVMITLSGVDQRVPVPIFIVKCEVQDSNIGTGGLREGKENSIIQNFASVAEYFVFLLGVYIVAWSSRRQSELNNRWVTPLAFKHVTFSFMRTELELHIHWLIFSKLLYFACPLISPQQNNLIRKIKDSSSWFSDLKISVPSRHSE